jgi:hypothetical protein
MSHHWDLFAPLICCVVNANVKDKKHMLTVEQIHPFREKKVKPFNRTDWLVFRAKIKGER